MEHSNRLLRRSYNTHHSNHPLTDNRIDLTYDWVHALNYNIQGHSERMWKVIKSWKLFFLFIFEPFQHFSIDPNHRQISTMKYWHLFYQILRFQGWRLKCASKLWWAAWGRPLTMRLWAKTQNGCLSWQWANLPVVGVNRKVLKRLKHKNFITFDIFSEWLWMLARSFEETRTVAKSRQVHIPHISLEG